MQKLRKLLGTDEARYGCGANEARGVERCFSPSRPRFPVWTFVRPPEQKAREKRRRELAGYWSRGLSCSLLRVKVRECGDYGIEVVLFTGLVNLKMRCADRHVESRYGQFTIPRPTAR